jgi:transposase-like protein
MGHGLWLCRDCEAQISVTAGTIFHRTRLPLRLWFRAIWYVTSQKNGVSALGVQRVLGLGSYQTAWSWLHKLRRAMVRPGRERLRGRVEVDEVFIGGKEPGFEGRSAPAKSLVAIAAEEDGEKTGRIRMSRIHNAKKPTLHHFIETMIAPGSVVCTDGWTSYLGLEEKGYRHEIITLKGQPNGLAIAAMPRVHRIEGIRVISSHITNGS